MNDWTDKIYVKDGDYIHRMEKDSHTEEAESSKARHNKEGMNDKLQVGSLSWTAKPVLLVDIHEADEVFLALKNLHEAPA